MRFGGFDKILFFSVCGILLIGIMTLYSASAAYNSHAIILRQIFWIFFGFLALSIALFIDYQKIVNVSYFLYGITVILLLFVLFAGKAKGGSHRWISLWAFNFQPSELAKITLTLSLALFVGERKNDINKISTVFFALTFCLPFFFLILIEPDLGGALILLPLTLAILFVGGTRLRHIFFIIASGLATLPLFWHFLKGYQRQRLMVFINPNIDPLGSGYTIIQSKIAVGSGGLFGKGWLSGTQSQLNFLPERHTDFIFSVVGEEWGFIGALILVLLFLLIVYRAAKIIETTPNIYGKLIATGFLTLFALQVVINIGMTIGILPIVGFPLPLISYGGSSLITTLFYIGLLLNIGMRRTLF